ASVGARETVGKRLGGELPVTGRRAAALGARRRREPGLAFVCGRETLSWILSCLLCRRVSEPRRRVGTLPARATRRCITAWPELDPTAPPSAARRVSSPLDSEKSTTWARVEQRIIRRKGAAKAVPPVLPPDHA